MHVYFKDEMLNDLIDVDAAVAKYESIIPKHFSYLEIEMIVLWVILSNFMRRGINAFYDGGTIYISNLQDDEEDILDDLVHELSHGVEDQYGYQIYGDQKI